MSSVHRSVPCSRLLTDLTADALDARLARAGPYIGPSVHAVVAPYAVSEEVYWFLWAPQASGFLFVDRQLQSVHEPLDRHQHIRRRCRAGFAPARERRLSTAHATFVRFRILAFVETAPVELRLRDPAPHDGLPGALALRPNWRPPGTRPSRIARNASGSTGDRRARAPPHHGPPRRSPRGAPGRPLV